MDNSVIQELIKKVNIYGDWVKKAAEAESFRDLDAAQVNGRIAFNDLAYTIVLADRPLLEVCDTRRAELINLSITHVQEVVQANRHEKNEVGSVEPLSAELKKVKPEAGEKKSNSKKAKK